MRALGIGGALALLLVPATLSAQAPARDEELTIVKSRRPVSFAAIRNTPGLIALTFMGYDRDFLAVARRTVILPDRRVRGLDPPWDKAPDPDSGEIVDYILDFYRREGEQFYKIGESGPGYIFMGMMREQGRGADRLVTTWGTGTAEALIIFARRNRQIVKVFSWAGKVTPEFIGLANDGEPYLVVTDGRFFEVAGKRTYPETALIYAWEGSRYVLKKKVPWQKRFEAVKDRWPREYPKE